MRQVNTASRAVLFLCLLGCAACSTVTPGPVTTVRLTPPSALLLETPEPRLAEPTNAGLLDYALDLRAALRKANADKAALREWASAKPAAAARGSAPSSDD